MPEKSAPQRSKNSLPLLAAAGLSAAGLLLLSKLTSTVRRAPVALRGKVALITGGSRGLGLSIAHELGEQGCRLALCARDVAELEEAERLLSDNGIEAAVFPGDITKEGEIKSLVDRVIQQFGRIDILVNDAGLIKVSPFENLNHGDFDEAMNLMFWAPANLTMAVLPLMKQQGGGHIVNIASVGGRVAVPHLLPYCCAKFAMVGFSTGLSAELDPNKIHVLTVVPGLMRTGSYLNAKFKGGKEQEFAWFGLLANLPGFSIAANDAAHSIRQALETRQLTCTISFPAKLLIQSEALAPEATRLAMQFASKYMLPKGGADQASTSGKAVNSKFGALFQVLTTLGRSAAHSLNE